MSKTYKDNKSRGGRPKREYHLSVRAVRRETPDLRKLSRAVIQMAMAEAQAEADAAAKSARAADDEAPDV